MHLLTTGVLVSRWGLIYILLYTLFWTTYSFWKFLDAKRESRIFYPYNFFVPKSYANISKEL